jgi:Glyoxalase/Bleomycin resistance protein/Dioxygenase superfamily
MGGGVVSPAGMRSARLDENGRPGPPRTTSAMTSDMTIKRLDHVSVVVDDLPAAIAFFTALGMTVEDEMPVEGP